MKVKNLIELLKGLEGCEEYEVEVLVNIGKKFNWYSIRGIEEIYDPTGIVVLSSRVVEE